MSFVSYFPNPLSLFSSLITVLLYNDRHDSIKREKYNDTGENKDSC